METMELALTPTMRLISNLWGKRWVRIGVQILMIVGFSALAAVAKKAHPSIGIPGSSGVYWLTAMVMGRSITRWDGAGFLTGLGVAAWGIPVGLEHTFGYNIALYAGAGVLIDLMARIPGVSIRSWWGAALCAFIAHMGKFGFITYAALSTSVARHFLIVGILNSALLHAAFGITAGLAGWGIITVIQKLVKRLSSGQTP